MNQKTYVRLSNITGLISIILLIFWVFIFIVIQVFGLKVFRENLTETFFMSILGILALMCGALIINVMFNLTRIAEKHNLDDNTASKPISKKVIWIFVLSFPVILGLLFAGDFYSAKMKEVYLINSAGSLIKENKKDISKLLDYSFNRVWLNNTKEILDKFSVFDKNFPNVSLIVNDTISDYNVLLIFKENDYKFYPKDSTQPEKKSYLFKTSKEEREYFNKVFKGNSTETRFSSYDGNYELFYPYSQGNKKVILYFSYYQRYGKIGS